MGAVFLREDLMGFSQLFHKFVALFPFSQGGEGVYRTHILMYLSMKMIYSLREPYDPPKGEIFKLRTTPREDIRTDIL